MGTPTGVQTETMNELIASASEMDGKYLTFWTDSQLYGVPIADVVQIVGLQEITEVPEFPYYAKGIINLRGSIIPLVDVRLRLGKMEIAYNERTCIIVTSIQGTEIGFIVDSVNEVADIDEADIAPPPTLSGETGSAYLTGIAKQGKQVVLLMDTGKILSGEAMVCLTGTL